MNLILRRQDLQSAVDRACGTNATVVHFLPELDSSTDEPIADSDVDLRIIQ